MLLHKCNVGTLVFVLFLHLVEIFAAVQCCVTRGDISMSDPPAVKDTVSTNKENDEVDAHKHSRK